MKTRRKFIPIILLLMAISSHATSPPVATQHPLDPLTNEEIKETTALIKAYRWGRFIFNYITLKEPPKSQLLPYFLNDTVPQPGSIPRKTFTIIYDRDNHTTYEVTVNLNEKKVEKWEDSPEGVTYANSQSEFHLANEIVYGDREVIKRCAALGYSNMSMVTGCPWPMGYVGDLPELKGKRLMQVYLTGINFEDDNENTHPFDFLPTVDLDLGRVIKFEEIPIHENFNRTGGKTNFTVPKATSNYWTTAQDPFPYRQGLNPIHLSQPNGSSFIIEGNEIRWQNFKFRLGFNGREGLILHNVNYKDGDNVRPLFYRMSLAELYVPYGDPRPPFHRKAALDEGDYGIGFTMLKLRHDMDCLGEVHFLNWPLYNDKGEPFTNPNSVCVHEEDTGVLWKHTDTRSYRSTMVRAQRLSLTFVTTFHNYDYVLSWNFYQDGTIEFNFRLTGLLTTNVLAVGSDAPRHATIVFPQIMAQYHQHFFTMRVDAEIDGNENSVMEVDVVPLEGDVGSKENPYGQGFTTNVTVFKTAASARTNVNMDKSRTWHMINPNKFNPYNGKPVAWKLQPWPSPPLLMKKDSPVRKRVQYMDYSTWVTPYHDEQMFPAGLYVNNSGLPEWVGKNPEANIENTDVVMWYTLGVTHIPRTEDFPSMPVETGKMTLKPVNFFIQNPSLDVPMPKERKKRDEL